MLVDTAIVGHLGTTQLAALAIAATVLSSAFALCIFLTYGTTAQVARLHGAGRDEEAAALGSQALWLGLAIGALLLVAALAFAPAAVRLMGGEDEVADGAVTYLRIAALGAPFFMLATAGQGFLRGIGDLRTPLVILVAAHAVNVVLELLFVYGFGWGLAGSAWGTVIAQAGMGAGVRRRSSGAPASSRRMLARMRPLIRIGAEIAVRTSALLASFLVASAVLARVSSPALAAHQIAFQLFVFLALVLDALAIAAQVMVGRALGAGDAVLARDAATRVILWSAVVGAGFGAVLLGLADVIPRAFTSDERVVDQAHEIWWLFAALMPLNGAVFALDGILIGAGDTRFLMWGDARLRGRLRAGGAPLARPGLGDHRGLVGSRRADRHACADLRRALPGPPMGSHRRTGVIPCAARMLRRILALALVAALLVPASAVAQQNQQQPNQDPFPPLPQPQPTPVAPPEEDNGFLGLDQEISGNATLYIAGALLIAFLGIGWFISRDARRALPADHRPGAPRQRDEGPHKHKRQAKAKARARGKAQRTARRRNR